MRQYLVALAAGGLQEQPQFNYSNFQIIEANSRPEACDIYDNNNNCDFFYGQVIAECENNGKMKLCILPRRM